LDILTVALSISIGNAVAWLIALYTKRGVQRLLWDVSFAMVGAALCAMAFVWLAPTLRIIGLLSLGPLCSVLMIFIGDAIRTHMRTATGRSR
jgi:hypothetical protein